MKIKVLQIILLFFLCSNAFGKNEVGIKFFHGTWEEAKIKAKEENKILFMDFYTQWCGPCLNMAKTVFVLPEVGRFYNDKFVCLKVDAETKEGRVLAKQYAVQSYPTYIFANPENEKIIHRNGSRQSAQSFIAIGKSALNPQMTSEYILSEYNKGNRNKEFMLSYVKYMASRYDNKAIVRGFKELISSGSRLSDPAIWKLYNDCISGYNNPYLKEVSNNYSKFVDLYGKEAVDSKLSKETVYCNREFMNELCDFEGKAFNIRLKKISDYVYISKNYSKAIASIDSLMVDKSVDKQKVIDRLKFIVGLNSKRLRSKCPDEWLYKCVEYLRYIAYNDIKRDDARIHFDYAFALEMIIGKIVKDNKEIPHFLSIPPEYGKKQYSNRPVELKMKPKRKK